MMQLRAWEVLHVKPYGLLEVLRLLGLLELLGFPELLEALGLLVAL